MTHKPVTLILLAELAILAGTARADLIKYVEVVIVTKPADADAIRNQAVKAAVEAREAVQRTERQLWRARLSRRPDREVLIDRAERAKRWAEDHRKKLKLQTAVEELYQAARLTSVATEAILPCLETKAPLTSVATKPSTKPRESDEAEAGRARRDVVARRVVFEEALHRIRSAGASVRSACRQLVEVNSPEPVGIIQLDLVDELHERVETIGMPLAELEMSLETSLLTCSSSDSELTRAKVIELQEKASQVQEYLEKLSGSMPRSDPHFRIEILYSNRICGRAGFLDDLYRDDLKYREYRELKYGETMHRFLVKLGLDGIPESTSDKAKLRITKSYNREPPEIAWGIWDIKDVWVAGYFAGDEGQDADCWRELHPRVLRVSRRKLLTELRKPGTRVELLPLTVADNYDASVLFSVETEQLHGFRPSTATGERTAVADHDREDPPELKKLSNKKPGEILQDRPKRLRVHRILYEWPFQNAVD